MNPNHKPKTRVPVFRMAALEIHESETILQVAEDEADRPLEAFYFVDRSSEEILRPSGKENR